MPALRSSLLGAGAAILAIVALAAPASADPVTGSSVAVDLSSPGSVASAATPGAATRLPGWTLPTGTSEDGEVTADGAFRLSNATRGDMFSHAGYVTAPLAVGAGESSVAAVNTLDASFTVADASTAPEHNTGLRIMLSLGSTASPWDRDGGNFFFVYDPESETLKFGAFWSPYEPNHTENPGESVTWVERVLASLDPATSHDIRLVAHFEDGDDDDVIDVYVDGVRVGEAATQEGRKRNKGQAMLPVTTLMFYAGANNSSDLGTTWITGDDSSAHPDLSGYGLLFSDLRYASYQVDPVPAAEPADLPAAPATTPDAPIAAPAQAPQPGGTVQVSAEGYEPYENVAFTWYSTPRFAAWLQADAYGRISGAVPLPAGLGAGETHTLQGVGERSGWTANALITLAAPEAGAAGDPELIATGSVPWPGVALAGAVVLLGGLLVLRRRRTAA